MICNKCGNNVGNGLSFCPTCGNDMSQQSTNYNQQPQPTYSGQPPYNNTPQPMYNGQPQYYAQPQKKGGNGCLIAFLITLGVFVLICVAGYFTIKPIIEKAIETIENEESNSNAALSNSNSNYSNSVNSNSNTTSNATSNTTSNVVSNTNSNNTSNSNGSSVGTGTFKLNGYVFNTPVGYTAMAEGEKMILTSGTKAIGMQMFSGSYDNIRANKSILQSLFSQSGYTVTNVQIAYHNNVEFISSETKIQGYTLIIAYAKIDSSNVLAISAVNTSTPNKADYSLLDTAAVSIRTARKG